MTSPARLAGYLMTAVAALVCLVVGCRGSASPTAGGPGTPPLDVSDCDLAAPIPDRPVRGWVHGQPFSLERSKLRDGILELRQGDDVLADRGVTIFTFFDGNADVEGKVIEVREGVSTTRFTPHIHVGWKDEGMDLPETEIFLDDYSMRLEFGQPTGRRLPGKIYACLNDPDPTVVSGTFRAEIR